MASILRCIPSRWGDNGFIVEADFSQLEVIYAAHISGDSNLMDDILSGKDLHCQNASLISEYSYEEMLEGKKKGCTERTEIRKKAKSFSFQLGYGAGAESIAADVGATVEEVQAFIDAYYGRYSRLKEWQQENISYVKENAKFRGKRTARGLPCKSACLVSETQRRYWFHETDAPDYIQARGTSTSFSPTNIKNYPVQGGATGDIVPMVLGALVRSLKKDTELKDKALLINTVHDSLILDVHEDVVHSATRKVKEVMESAPSLYLTTFGIPFTLPLPCDVSWGRTWLDAKSENAYSL